jgi:hypothetical protein
VRPHPTPGEVFDDLADILTEMLGADGRDAAMEIIERLDAPKLPSARQVRRRHAPETFARLLAEGGWPGPDHAHSEAQMARLCGLSRRQLGRWLKRAKKTARTRGMPKH